MRDEIRVLHVDDDPDFADLTATYLEREDERFAVETATSADDGLAQLDDGFDCVLSDYDMPGRNGIEFLAAVREGYPDIPFVLYTGKGSEEVASDAISAGVTDYFQKQTGPEQYELLSTRILTAVGQYRAERELERQNDLFAKTQDLANVGAWEYDPQDGTVYFTDTVYEIYGVDTDYDPDPEQDIQRFYHPEDRDTVRGAVAGALESGEDYDIEVRITAADGTDKWVRTRGTPEVDDGVVQRVRGTIRDITERKEQERNLEQTKEWYRTLLDTAPDAVFVADADSGEIRETNQAATRLLGRPREEIVGMHQTELHPPGNVEADADLFSEHVDSGGGRDETLGEQVEIYVGNADDDRIPVEINARAVEIDGESLNQGYFRDITERKERERELRRQNERLDEFITVVSHDLQNLLRTLSLSLELLETDDADSLERCFQSVDRMESLIDDLLVLARQGETGATAEPVRLSAVAEDCARTTLRSETSLAIETDAQIFAERTRLKQLFENLFANAVEHGGPDVSITVGSLDDGFYVEDDGPGISPAEREHCFRIGYSTSEQGTGFGLNIVKQVAAAHGWDVRVTDGDAGGARFEVTGVERVH